MRLRCGTLLAITVLAFGCGRTEPPAREYRLQGQIIAIKPEAQEVVVKHDDIPGFMPAMTMPYRVGDAGQLEGKQPGDLISATLVVGENEAHLSSITKTGAAPVETATIPGISASELLDAGEQVPDNALVDQDKTPRPLSSLRGHRIALTFMYTRCPIPDFCPLMDRNFSEVQQAIKKTPELADARLVSVTLDPEYDTPAVLKKHAQALKADPAVWHFVTGDKEELARFWRPFGITAEPGDDSAAVVHNLRTAVIDPQGKVVKVTSGNMWTPAELIADLKAAPAPAN
jgi:protein SCO1/2